MTAAKAHASLGRVIIRGGGMTSVSTLVEKLLAIVQLAVVARLLSPDDFGIFALALVLLMGFETLGSIGIDRILIHRKELSPSFIASAWMAALLRGIAVALAVMASAFLYSGLLHSERIYDVLLIIAWGPVIASFRSPGRVLAERQFQFFRVAIFQMVCAVVRLAVTVVLAYQLRDVEALAWGQLMAVATATVFSWLWFAFPALAVPRLSEMYELIGTGKHYVLIGVGTFVTTQADNLIIGAWLGTAMLGVYVLVYQISQLPVDLQTKVVSKVMLPAFSHLHGDEARMWKAYSKSLRVQAALLISLMVGAVVLAEPLVLGLLGQRYSEGVPLMQVLMLLAFCRGMSQFLSLLFLAANRVEIAGRTKLVEAVTFVLLVGIGTMQWQLMGAAVGATAAYALGLFIRFRYLQRLTGWEAMHMLSPMSAALIASLASGVVAGLAAYWLKMWPPAELVLLGLIYLVTVALMILKFDSQTVGEIGSAFRAAVSEDDKGGPA